MYAGWHVVLCHYRNKITGLLGEMFALLPTIRAENHTLAFEYLCRVWKLVCLFTSSLKDVDDPGKKQNLWPRFSSYVEAEERRLNERLNTFQYCIDGRDTLALITGPGRIEKVHRISYSGPYSLSQALMRKLVPLAALIPSPASRSRSFPAMSSQRPHTPA